MPTPRSMNDTYMNPTMENAAYNKQTTMGGGQRPQQQHQQMNSFANMIRLDDLLPVDDEQFNSEMYANDMKKVDNIAKQRGVRGNQQTNGGIKSLDVAHWAKNIPQQVRDDVTATSGRGGYLGMASNSVSNTYMGEPTMNVNEDMRYGQMSGRGGVNQAPTPGIGAFIKR